MVFLISQTDEFQNAFIYSTESYGIAEEEFFVETDDDQSTYFESPRQSKQRSIKHIKIEESLSQETSDNHDQSLDDLSERSKIKVNEKLQMHQPQKINQSPIVVQKCTRWCCQRPELPPVYDDSCTIFGKFVAEELRLMSTEFERQKCKMRINTILFKACIGKFDGPDDKVEEDIKVQHFYPQLSYTNENDHIASYGRYIATELKTVKNATARQIAKSKICLLICEHFVDPQKCREEDETQTLIECF